MNTSVKICTEIILLHELLKFFLITPFSVTSFEAHLNSIFGPRTAFTENRNSITELVELNQTKRPFYVSLLKITLQLSFTAN